MALVRSVWDRLRPAGGWTCQLCRTPQPYNGSAVCREKGCHGSLVKRVRS